MSALSVLRLGDGTYTITDAPEPDTRTPESGEITGLIPQACMDLAMALARAARADGASWPSCEDVDVQEAGIRRGLQLGVGERPPRPVLRVQPDERVGPLLEAISTTKCELTRVMHLLSQAGDVVDSKR